MILNIKFEITIQNGWRKEIRERYVKVTEIPEKLPNYSLIVSHLQIFKKNRGEIIEERYSKMV